MAATQKIGVLLPMQLAYCRGIMSGITRYAVPAKPWVFYPYDMMNLELAIVRQFQKYQLDGVIVYTGDSAILAALRRWKIPVVNVAAVTSDDRIPNVRVDDHAVGTLVAKHFLERGYRSFAYFGNLRSEFARFRLEGYRHVLQEKGYEVRTPPADIPPPWSWAISDSNIRKWLLQLPKPVGIFGYTDNTCRLFATICREARVHIPEEVALVGVDNDVITCEMSYPPLSSVEQPLEQIGYRAAEILGAMMSGEGAPKEPVVLPPVGVVTRQSSDIVAIHDPDVGAAMQFIREHGGEPIRVEDILDHVPLNRRSLEKRFRANVGHSILTEINRTHIERAKLLLLNTRMPIEDVALRAGFNSATRFGIVFKSVTGKTPNQFRKTFTPG